MPIEKKREITFWVRNVSKMNVCLSDLRLTIPAKSNMNLLSKHFSYSLDQLLLSLQSGSLFKKRDKIVLRKFPPVANDKVIQIDLNSIRPSTSKSIVDHVSEVFLDLSEENSTSKEEADAKFAEEMADLADRT